MKRRINRVSMLVTGVTIAGASITSQAKAVAAAAEVDSLPISSSLNSLDVSLEVGLEAGVYQGSLAPPDLSVAPSFSPSNREAIAASEEILMAQGITSANDGTGTVVNQAGDQFNIEGGSRSGDNLFHSFEQLGLDAGQIANFMSNPDIQNILGRVVGGDASVINGLIQVTGGNSNLFLMNPAGIVFGPDAQLNVPAAFTATTANGIQMDDYWFKAMGSNDYANLVGTPNGFAFSTDQPGTILNAGNLRVSSGESVRLLGGLVINTGTISAPGGDITILSVPGENLVSISQEGSLLSLALPANAQAAVNGSAQLVTPLSLPELLTGGGLPAATGVVAENGVVKLTSSDTVIPTEAGTTIVSGVVDAANLAAGGIGGNIDVLGDRVGLLNARLDVSGTSGSGSGRIGGDYQGRGAIPNAERTYIDEGTSITANALVSGDGGQVIVWADGGTQFLGEITARGGTESGDGGFVEVSGEENLSFEGSVDISAEQGDSGTLLLDPENIIISNDASSSGIEVSLPNILEGEFPGNITVNADVLDDQLGNIVLEAKNNITIADGISLNFISSNGSITFTADSDASGEGSFEMDSSQTITTNGRDLEISGNEIKIGNIDTVSDDGTVLIESGGSVVAADISGQSVEISAVNSITTEDIRNPNVGSTSDTSTSFVRLTTKTDNIQVGYILAGVGGIYIDSGGLFQALGYRSATISKFEFDDVPIVEALPETVNEFLIASGYGDFSGSIDVKEFLVSLESVDGPIFIRYGQDRQVIFDNLESSIDPATGLETQVSGIFIEGDPSQYFVIGPDYDDANPLSVFESGANSLIVTANSDPFSFPSGAFPSEANGTVAGIANSRTDSSLDGSLQDRTFGTPPPSEPPQIETARLFCDNIQSTKVSNDATLTVDQSLLPPDLQPVENTQLVDPCVTQPPFDNPRKEGESELEALESNQQENSRADIDSNLAEENAASIPDFSDDRSPITQVFQPETVYSVSWELKPEALENEWRDVLSFDDNENYVVGDIESVTYMQDNGSPITRVFYSETVNSIGEE